MNALTNMMDTYSATLDFNHKHSEKLDSMIDQNIKVTI